MYSLKKTTLTIHFILLTCIAFCNCWDVDFLNENKNVVNLFHNSLIKKFKKEFFKLNNDNNRFDSDESEIIPYEDLLEIIKQILNRNIL